MKQGWEIKKIKDICDKASSNIVQNKITELDGDYPVYGASGYVQNVDFFHRDSPYIGIVKDGAGVGRVNIYPAYSSLLGTLQYIIPKDGYLLEYVAYALKGLNLASYASGATIPHIYFKNYGEIEISVVPLPEQEKIVAELDCLSGIIEKKKQQLKEYDALAQSIFYEMFGNSVGGTNKWNTCCIGDIYKFQYGKGNKIPESRGEFPCYGSNGQVGYHTEYNSEDAPIIGHIGAYAGIVNWASGKHYVTYNGVICNLKNEAFNPIYGFYLLKAQNYMENARGGAAQPFVSYDMLEAPITHIPPLSLQQEFASKIEAIEKQKELIKQSIAETETLFNSRMDYYFN